MALTAYNTSTELVCACVGVRVGPHCGEINFMPFDNTCGLFSICIGCQVKFDPSRQSLTQASKTFASVKASDLVWKKVTFSALFFSCEKTKNFVVCMCWSL